MNVRSIFRPWVVSVDGDERLADAAERMHNEQVGSVVVMVGGRFGGILTERDLTAAIGQGADPATTRCRTRLPRLRRFPGPTANSPRVRWAGTAAVSTPPGGSTGCCSAKLAQRHPAGSRPTTAAGGR
jgi:CBS-domain-containing membrane protein